MYLEFEQKKNFSSVRSVERQNVEIQIECTYTILTYCNLTLRGYNLTPAMCTYVSPARGCLEGWNEFINFGIFQPVVFRHFGLRHLIAEPQK
jgi:hypothetical protein